MAHPMKDKHGDPHLMQIVEESEDFFDLLNTKPIAFWRGKVDKR